MGVDRGYEKSEKDPIRKEPVREARPYESPFEKPMTQTASTSASAGQQIPRGYEPRFSLYCRALGR